LTAISDAETAFARESLGARAVYLPAFRAILERSSTDSYYENRERQAEIEAIRKSEIEIARTDPGRVRNLAAHRVTEQHRLTAAKTVQCRQWFGSFVPVIRYPSLVDVRTRLIDEAREATFDMGLFEQSLFSKLFTQVFKAISSSSESGVADNTDQLLDEVQAALSSIDSVYAAPIDVYGEIKDAMAEARSSGSLQNKTAASILRLYSTLLLERSTKHKEIFSKIRDFERSVNLFLDGKRLVVNERQLGGGRGVSVYASNDRPMNLSALSSGERQVLTMIFCASRLAEDRGIFLVDEPELSLHVDWQRSILGEVVRQAEGRQVIACTHSPEVGADHFDAVQLFEPKPTRRLQEDLFVEFDAAEDV
jgi:predicted ATPase